MKLIKEMESDIDQVLAAVDTLYLDSATGTRDKNDVEKASIFLGDLQKTVQAWKIADQLLHMKRDVKSCFFAAQTLRTKIQYYFAELPTDAHESLRASMLEHLSHITEGTYQGIATQLCVAVADLALLMVSWEDPIGDLIKQFGPNAEKPNLVPLLEVLIALPEEQISKQIKLGSQRRNQLYFYFQNQVVTIIHLLNVAVMQVNSGAADEGIHLKALRCLSSWFNIKTTDWKHLTETCIVTDMLNIVGNPHISSRLHEIGTDCICSAMIMLETQRIPELTSVLFAGVLQLEPCYQLAVAMEDLTAVTNYARMFAELGETLTDVLVKDSDENQEGSLQILHLLITSVGHHEWEVAEITFNFWYKLSEVLYRKNCDKATLRFRPYVERLIKALYRHCQIDSDHEGILGEAEDFYEFRERVQELMKDIAFISESKACFLQMSALLQTPECLKNWNHLEAALFIMQSVARNLLPDDNEIVPPILDGVLNQPEGIHVQVACTSILLLGELSEWLALHQSVLPSVLTFLTKRLHNQQLATVAAKSLVVICHSCRDHMDSHFEGLMAIATSLNVFSISNEAAVDLLKSVAYILGRLPLDQVALHMKELCNIQVKPLQSLIQGEHAYQKNMPSDPVLWLDRLSAIFRTVNPVVQEGEQHPCQEVVMSIWPTLSATFQKYSNNIRIMEHSCRCLRFAVRCVHQQSAPLLQPLVETIVGLYTIHGYSCFVYLGSILVDEYAHDAGCVAGLLNMLQAFSQPTFTLLTQANGFMDHPDTVDDWFRLCTRFLQRAPVPFLHCNALENIIQCGLQACLLDHKDANAAVMKFFQDLLDVGMKHDEAPDFQERKGLVEVILNTHGQSLVNNLITTALFIIPSYMLQEVSDTLRMIMAFDRVKFCGWLENKLKEIPRTNSGGIEAVTTAQIVELHKVITMANRSKEITRALEEFSRYFT